MVAKRVARVAASLCPHNTAVNVESLHRGYKYKVSHPIWKCGSCLSETLIRACFVGCTQKYTDDTLVSSLLVDMELFWPQRGNKSDHF